MPVAIEPVCRQVPRLPDLFQHTRTRKEAGLGLCA